MPGGYIGPNFQIKKKATKITYAITAVVFLSLTPGSMAI